MSINVENQNRVLQGSFPQLELDMNLNARDEGPHLSPLLSLLLLHFRGFSILLLGLLPQSLVPVRGGGFWSHSP